MHISTRVSFANQGCVPGMLSYHTSSILLHGLHVQVPLSIHGFQRYALISTPYENSIILLCKNVKHFNALFTTFFKEFLQSFILPLQPLHYLYNIENIRTVPAILFPYVGNLLDVLGYGGADCWVWLRLVMVVRIVGFGYAWLWWCVLPAT